LPQRAGYPLPRFHLPHFLHQIGEQLAQRRQVSQARLVLSARHASGLGALGSQACLVSEAADNDVA
jgi:hypothetical protein